MLYGIIDVGSNTIRLNIYSYENESVKSLLHKKTMAGLAGYVGGTIRAARKLKNELFETKESLTLEVDNISEILPLLHKPNKQTLHRILQIVPDRIHTITPGLLILHTIAEFFGSETIHVSGYGVREGYLYSKVLREGE